MLTKTVPNDEYEPLISHERISLQPDALHKQRSKPCTTRKTLASIAALLLTAVSVYFLMATFYHPQHPGLPNTSRTYSWMQMESTHQHAAHIPQAWAETDECSDEHEFTLTLALKQQNTEALHEHVAAVSHSGSDSFHEYWTPNEVRDYFKPSDDALTAVTAWLEAEGFTSDNGKLSLLSTYGNVIKLSVTCGDANRLLNAKYMNYESTREDGKTHLRVKDGLYHIPDEVHEHVDFVSPTIRFPIQHHTLKVEALSDELASKMGLKLAGMSQPVLVADSDSESTPNTPEQLYAMYGMTDTMAEILGDTNDMESLTSTTCRQSVASFIDQYYDDSDLTLFRQELNVAPASVMERIPDTQPDGYGSEAELDVQYMTSTGKGIYTYVFYIDSDDIFVSLAEAILDTDTPPLVVSISYGADEYELGVDWTTRCNEEFGKLALIGTTVLASSGDSGVRGNDDDCMFSTNSLNNQDKQDKKHSKRRRMKGMKPNGRLSRADRTESVLDTDTTDGYSFVTSFPASATYVTAIGGTTGGTIQADSSTSTGETAWTYSGGGFSIYFDAPDWQTSAISGYFDTPDLDVPQWGRYETAGRAYPDLAAQSVDYVIAYDQSFYLVSGTSASSPTVAGMLSMINYARIQAGKSSLGFLNPALYKLYDAERDTFFNDVTDGYNIGCEVDSDIGFYAAPGWDPVTGMGTPKFDNLYAALLDLK